MFHSCSKSSPVLTPLDSQSDLSCSTRKQVPRSPLLTLVLAPSAVFLAHAVPPDCHMCWSPRFGRSPSPLWPALLQALGFCFNNASSKRPSVTWQASHTLGSPFRVRCVVTAGRFCLLRVGLKSSRRDNYAYEKSNWLETKAKLF